MVNIAYIVLAQKTWRGVFTENAYQKGVDYNKTLEKIKKQEKLGIRVSTVVDPRGNNDYFLETSVTDLNGNNISNISVIYTLRYPSEPNRNFSSIAINRSGSYVYQFINLPKAGVWELETAVSFGDNVVQDIKYITVRPKVENEIKY